MTVVPGSCQRDKNYARNLAQRLAAPALNAGRIQRAARRLFLLHDEVTTAMVAERAYCRRIYLRRLRLEPHHYRRVRRVLSRIAEPIGRAGGMGRNLIWRARV
jgi:hypothetical protein